MNFFKGQPGEQKWSMISQRARLELARLEADLDKCKGLIFWHEKEVKRCEEISAHQVGLAVRGDGTADYWMPQSLEQLENMRRRVAAFKEHSAALQAKIDALAHPTAQLAERAEKCSLLAKLAAERLDKDRLADRALQELRRILGERAQLTALMSEAASAADFTIVDDCLDKLRFKTLSNLLPAELAATSEIRAAGLFEEEREK